MTTATLYFDYLRRLVQERCGVLLDPDKEYLIGSALEPVQEKWGFDSVPELMARLWQEPEGSLSRRVVEALIPSETYFFRDPSFFEALEKKVLPELVEKRSKVKRLSVWSAACSSGQEPYSLAILMKEKFPFLFQWNLTLVASDFSRGVLDRAREGLYSPRETGRGLPPQFLPKYFHPAGPDWRVNDDIRGAIDFREVNLKDPGAKGSGVDLLLLRNAMIYFDLDMKKKVLTRLEKSISPGGYLFLGASETTLFLDHPLKTVVFDGSIAGYQLRT